MRIAFRALPALATALVLLNVAPAFADNAPTTDGQCVALPDAGRCPAWGHNWSNPGGNNDACANNNVPQNEVAGRDGLYVTGWACDSQDKAKPEGGWIPGNDMFTVAYNLDGSTRWVARYNGPGGAQDAIGDEGRGIALSPSGDRLYVTGAQNEGLGGTSTEFRFVGDMVTIAYDTATGAQLWRTAYHGPAVGEDMGEQVGVSGDGQRLYVTGESQAPDLPDGSAGGSEAATISYVAATGEQDWVARYRVPDSIRNNAIGTTSIAVQGSRVITSGTYQTRAGSGYEVLAIDDDRVAHRGVQVWDSTSEPQAFFHPARGGLAATPSGVFLAGTQPSTVSPPSTCPPQQTSGAADAEYATVKLDPSTGERLWSRSYAGQTGGNNGAYGVATDATGSRVFVAGQASGPAPLCAVGIATVAYDGETGAPLWSDYRPPPAGTSPQGFAITANTDGSRVFVAGLEYHTDTLGYRGDSAVFAYDGAGAVLWSARYNTAAQAGTALDLDSFAYFLHLSPAGDRLYLTDMVNRHDEASPGLHQLFGSVAYDTLDLPGSDVPETPYTVLLPLLTLALLAGGVHVRRARERT